MLTEVVWRGSGSKPTAREFNIANEQGHTRIVVAFEDSPCEAYWQYLKDKWCFVKRWRVAKEADHA